MPATSTTDEELGGLWMSVSTENNVGSPVTWRALALFTVFWLGVGLFGGTAEYLGMRSSEVTQTWWGTYAHFLIAGALWIPLSLAIIWGSRRYPPATLHPKFKVVPARAAAHGFVSLAISFVFNAVFFGILLILGAVPDGQYTQLFTETALRLIHINAGVYWVIVAVADVPGVLATQAEALKRAETQFAFDETLTIRSGAQSILVRVADIRWIEGAGDYVRLHLGIAKHLHSERLKRLESRLDPDRFVRVHRSAIVNVAAVRKLRHLGHGDYEAILDGGSSVRVSRTRRSQLTEVLEKRSVGDSGSEADRTT